MNPKSSEASSCRTRLMLPWLCLSLLLNGALAWKISRPQAGSSLPVAAAPADSPRAQITETPAVTSGLARPPSTTPTNQPQFHWSQFESEDYRQYVANLRAIGCPEEMVRDILRADIAQAYAEKVCAIWSPSEAPYWQKHRNTNPNSKQTEELMALAKDQGDAFAQLFAVRSKQQDLIDLAFLQLHGNRQELSFLPPGQRDTALQALTDAGLDDELSERPRSSKDEKARYDEKLKVLAKVLSPEELEQYRLRHSPALQSLRNEIQYFECTPEELNRLTEAREKSNNQALNDLLNRTAAVQQVRELFGDDRAREFERTTDLFYINARRAADKNGVPLERVDQAWSLTRDVRAELDRISKNTSIPRDDRRAQLNALREKTAAQLKEMLGPQASRAVIRDLKPFFSIATGNLK